MVQRSSGEKSLHGAHEKPVAKMIRLESHLGTESEDHFYTGFSNEIDQGGIFVTTFNIQPVNTPAEVWITFPEGEKISVQGAVEWIREFNPLVPEMQPGMGIGLRGIGDQEKHRIEDYILNNPSFFWDDSKVEVAPENTPPPTDDIQLFEVPVGLGLEPDIQEEHRFLKGMLRDIGEYMKTREPIEPDSWATCGTPVATGAMVVRARMTPERTLPGFAGGFTDAQGERRVFVSTDHPLPIGAPVVLHLQGGRSGEYVLRGTVCWVRRKNPLVGNPLVLQGMGIRVDDEGNGVWRLVNPGRGVTLMCEELG